MKTMKCFALLVVVGSLLALNACNKGSHGPTAPENQNVAGNWGFVGTLTSNSCDFLQDSPDFQPGAVAVEFLTLAQAGTTLNASTSGGGTVFGSGRQFTGSIAGNAFTLAMTNPDVANAGSCTFTIGGGADGTLADETSGNGSVNLTVAHAGGNCAALGTLPCSVVYTGTWLKRDAAKIANPQGSREETSLVQKIQSAAAHH